MFTDERALQYLIEIFDNHLIFQHSLNISSNGYVKQWMHRNLSNDLWDRFVNV